MFIIVPKSDKRTPNDVNNGQIGNTNEQDEKGPVRTTTACDSCRFKKTKCNGQHPCGPCKRKRIICVYSQPTQRDVSASAGRITLLQHQQRRLCCAIQQMASVIAKYEGPASRSPSSFDVLELLDQYAPQHLVDEQMALVPLREDDSRPNKRQRDDLDAHSALSTQGIAESNDFNEAEGFNVPFEIQPSPQYFARSEDSSAAYEAMMQFLRSMSSGQQSVSTANPPADLLSINTDGLHEPPNNHASLTCGSTGANIAALGTTPNPAFSPPSVDPAQQWMDLVDWETSLQNLQESHNIFSSNTTPENDQPTNNTFDTSATPNYSSYEMCE